MTNISAKFSLPVGRDARGNWRRMVAESGLPVGAKVVVTRVIRRCRLRGESARVAEELVGHFSDALSTGVAAEKAVVDFGDPALAARLIRRAMLRRRSRAWHLLRLDPPRAGGCIADVCDARGHFLCRPAQSVCRLSRGVESRHDANAHARAGVADVSAGDHGVGSAAVAGVRCRIVGWVDLAATGGIRRRSPGSRRTRPPWRRQTRPRIHPRPRRVDR